MLSSNSPSNQSRCCNSSVLSNRQRPL